VCALCVVYGVVGDVCCVGCVKERKRRGESKSAEFPNAFPCPGQSPDIITTLQAVYSLQMNIHESLTFQTIRCRYTFQMKTRNMWIRIKKPIKPLCSKVRILEITCASGRRTWWTHILNRIGFEARSYVHSTSKKEPGAVITVEVISASWEDNHLDSNTLKGAITKILLLLMRNQNSCVTKVLHQHLRETAGMFPTHIEAQSFIAY